MISHLKNPIQVKRKSKKEQKKEKVIKKQKILKKKNPPILQEIVKMRAKKK